MKPGLNIGDAITVDVNYYYNNKLQRGDIILYSAPIEGNKSLYIHRCIALPGDKFSIKNNAVFINDKKLEELYTIGITEYDFDKRNLEGIVPKNMVIILGDNRENSMDSRYYLYVPIKNIKGKYIKKIIKFNVST
jgi:signal peptidase I